MCLDIQFRHFFFVGRVLIFGFWPEVLLCFLCSEMVFGKCLFDGETTNSGRKPQEHTAFYLFFIFLGKIAEA